MSETKDQMVERMADLIVSTARDNDGNCTRDHMRQAGFNEQQIDSCFPLASGLASVTLNRKIENN